MEEHIEHDIEHSRFIMNSDGKVFYLNYIAKNNVVEITEVIIPEDVSFDEICSSFIETVLTYFSDAHKKVIPTCPYVAAYIQRHYYWKMITVN
ncbi:GNAT family N-acetyltransferase [Kangiella sp. HZ709]|uniref:GNAT family N-acetyltransferase n=1 Tax=Kangiella sp. HZ709 TaxID=2666328 RepID=UPI0012AF9BD5|nr:N-acetyltransferase [Kangiella sp. HZ709]MRX26885.1 hypothetical protein [Kangiella sp. HZ709]